MKVIEAIPDGRGVHMLDGKMQDDATWKQCKVMVGLAEMLAEKDPELKQAYGLFAAGGVACAGSAAGPVRAHGAGRRRRCARATSTCSSSPAWRRHSGSVAPAAEPRQLAQPDPQRHAETVESAIARQNGDLGGSHRQLAQRHDDRDELVGRAVRDRPRRRRAIQQPGVPVGPVAPDPLRAGALAHSGRLGGLRPRPPCSSTRNTIVSRPWPSGALA